jgi:hypothetical protein
MNLIEAVVLVVPRETVCDLVLYTRDPNHEDLTELRLLELNEDSPQGQMFARRLRDQNEDRVIEAEQTASAARAVDTAEEPDTRDDALDMTVGEALQNGLRRTVLGDKSFLQAVRDRYKGDSVFSKIVDNPGHYPMFRLHDGLIHTKNHLGDECLCVPRSLIWQAQPAGSRDQFGALGSRTPRAPEDI